MTQLRAQAALSTGRNHVPSLTTFTNEHKWMLKGACASLTPNESDRIFFPNTGGSAKKARIICATCPVLDTCRTHGIDNPQDDGVLGGLTQRQRKAFAVIGDKALEDGAA